MKDISCGVILCNADVVLLGHSTGNSHWDIPKGLQSTRESHIDAAIRELKEETGIVLDSRSLDIIGRFNYVPKKDLYLFLYWNNDIEKIFPKETLKCTSFFTKNRHSFPEIDGFKYVSWNDIEDYVTKNLLRVLLDVKETIIFKSKQSQ